MTGNDAELVARCMRGDASAMRELITRFHPDVYGLCMRMLRHAQDAEDVAQEVYLRIFRGLGKWDCTRPLRPWVMTITVNRCRTYLARRPRIPEPVDYLGETAASEHQRTTDPELLQGLQLAVDQLRGEYREAFILFHEHGQPYEVIAEMMNRPVGTIKTWLHRARAEIMTKLNQRGLLDPEPPASEPIMNEQPDHSPKHTTRHG